MCFSAGASFTAAAALIPTGAGLLTRAALTDPRKLAVAALPLLFGTQQAIEGAIWMANAGGTAATVERLSLGYMFFSWLVWPVWIPVSAYFLEPARRRSLFLFVAIIGGMLGGLQYIPYFAHEGWLTTRFFPRAISYEGKELLDYVIGREATYTIYVAVVIGALFLSSRTEMRIFGLLAAGVLAITYTIFAYAYVSVFCFGAAVVSLYLIRVVRGDIAADSAD